MECAIRIIKMLIFVWAKYKLFSSHYFGVKFLFFVQNCSFLADYSVLLLIFLLFAAIVWWIDFSCTGCGRSHEATDAIRRFWCNALKIVESWRRPCTWARLWITGHGYGVPECWPLWWIWYGRCNGIRTRCFCVWLTWRWTTDTWSTWTTSTGRRSQIWI